MIDLHTHSTASDGTLEPTDLIAAAAEARLDAVALTDHDTLAGIPEFLAAPAPRELARVPGVEITVHWYSGALHILGLLVDHRCETLRQLLDRIQASRRARNRQIVAALAARGLRVTLPADRVVCRSHFARQLMEQGHVDQPQKAFDRWLGHGRPAHVPLDLPSPAQAIAAIHAAGGLAIWAHPTGLNGRSRARVRKACRQLLDQGLDGIEAYYSEYVPAQQRAMLELAEDLDLPVSGGSDFHGGGSPGISLGTGRGKLAVPTSVYERLVNSRRRSA